MYWRARRSRSRKYHTHQQNTVKTTATIRKGKKNCVVCAVPDSFVWKATLEKTV